MSPFSLNCVNHIMALKFINLECFSHCYNMCVYIYVCVRTYVCACVDRMCAYVQDVSVFVYVHACVCERVCMCSCTYMSVCTSLCAHVHK